MGFQYTEEQKKKVCKLVEIVINFNESKSEEEKHNLLYNFLITIPYDMDKYRPDDFWNILKMFNNTSLFHDSSYFKFDLPKIIRNKHSNNQREISFTFNNVFYNNDHLEKTLSANQNFQVNMYTNSNIKGFSLLFSNNLTLRIEYK